MALANLLDTEGYGARVVHTGVEEAYDRTFNVQNLLKKYDASIVGLDLHWYVHSYDALRIAEKVKQASNAFVVLGGFTASFFAEEILTRFESVDAVIRGDAEVPLLELVKHWRNHNSREGFDKIPNLMYRQGTSLKQSSRRYIADASRLNQLNFSDFTLLDHVDQYLKLSLSVESSQSNLNRLAYPCLGRGCSMNCAYCGGGQEAHHILTGLDTPVFLSKEKVVEQIVRFVERKISSIYMGFDPDPEKRAYHKDLFAMIRRENIDVGCQFESWDISNHGFLKDFRRTFNPLYSSLIHSIQSGSEEVRNRNTGYHYTNDALFRWLNHAKDELIPVELAFASGLSWETEKHFHDTITMATKIVADYPMVLDLYCIPTNLEPCSPRSLYPKKYGLTLKFKDFIDYYDFFRRISEGSPLSSVLGYETDYLSEPQILELTNRFYQELRNKLTGQGRPPPLT